jgi:hypothetical protein
MFGFTFTAPLVLATLTSLPALWLLLRITPPRPQLIAFPPLKILLDLLPEKQKTAHTPWWLLALRLAIAALLILTASGPRWERFSAPSADQDKPLLVLIDNSSLAAREWNSIQSRALQLMEKAAQKGRLMTVLGLASRPESLDATAPEKALQRLRSLTLMPHLAKDEDHRASVDQFLKTHPEAEVVFISSGLELKKDQAARVPSRANHYAPSHPDLRVLTSYENEAVGMRVQIRRADPHNRASGFVQAFDRKGSPLMREAFQFSEGSVETSVLFEAPVELRNTISRIDIAGENAAPSVLLVDSRGQRRRVGLVEGGSIDQSQPLLSPHYYLKKALSPFADVREGKGGAADSIQTLLNEQVSTLILSDLGALEAESAEQVRLFMEEGGILVRFAGARLAANDEGLTPVRLRRGGRSVGGALSWDKPKTLAPFSESGPFSDLIPPSDILVQRQLLAEPDGQLSQKIWASLQDGTPLVTGERRGKGWLVLFHVTADPAWSNLPLSGLYVDMLRRLIDLSVLQNTSQSDVKSSSTPLAPRLMLEGTGAFITPSSQALPLVRGTALRGELDHPPGFYGPVENTLAVNALSSQDSITKTDYKRAGITALPLSQTDMVDMRAFLLTLALLLLIFDTFIALWLNGSLRIPLLLPRRAVKAALVILVTGFGALTFPSHAQAQGQAQVPATALETALITRLAYVKTGDAQIDRTSQSGLSNLSQVLSLRTALEPGDPVGVDPARDELAFFPFLYWPIHAAQGPTSRDALRKLEAYMKNGGTVIFDTRDALSAVQGGPVPRETGVLRAMLKGMDIPPLEPLPVDHVLTKTFYLLPQIVGRYSEGQTWVEAMPLINEKGQRQPARAGDGVSPIIMTNQDLAAGWAVNDMGDPLYPLSGNDPRQQEMALRAGINLVIYALTGNYKADQVHVPALLERLGQ